MAVAPDPNLVSIAAAAAISGVVTFLVARFGRHFDARGQAEAELLGIGPKVIKEQNDRIRMQNERIDGQQREIERIWELEHKCRVDLAAALRRIDELERRMGEI